MSEWTPEYSLGIEEIDNDHKRLFGIINVLNYAWKPGEELRSDFWNLLFVLNDIFGFHFDMEERLMEKYDYPDLKEHKVEHEKIRLHFYELKKEHSDNKLLLANKFKEFIQEWFEGHIVSHDKNFSYFLKDKLVT